MGHFLKINSLGWISAVSGAPHRHLRSSSVTETETPRKMLTLIKRINGLPFSAATHPQLNLKNIYFKEVVKVFVVHKNWLLDLR